MRVNSRCSRHGTLLKPPIRATNNINKSVLERLTGSRIIRLRTPNQSPAPHEGCPSRRICSCGRRRPRHLRRSKWPMDFPLGPLSESNPGPAFGFVSASLGLYLERRRGAVSVRGLLRPRICPDLCTAFAWCDPRFRILPRFRGFIRLRSSKPQSLSDLACSRQRRTKILLSCGLQFANRGHRVPAHRAMRREVACQQ